VLAPLRVNPYLAGLREPSALIALPTAEREECLAIWREVDALLARATGTP
jgi:hypothetical protein